MYKPSQKILGYHGTYPENIESIQEFNFKESSNHDIWLGDGVYFFIEGIGADLPKNYAKTFAIDQSYDKLLKKYTKSEYCVLEAYIKINENNLLDLTEVVGNQMFNKFRSTLISTIEKHGKKVVGEYKDTDVLKIMRDQLGIDVVKSNVYIKFAIQRKMRFESKIPNVTILAVRNPTKNIIKPSIKVVEKGGIL